MAIRNVVQEGDDILTKKCRLVEKFDDKLFDLLDDMADTMYNSDGVGLAAPQVGISQRFFVCMADDDVKRVFINPQIIETSSELSDYEEGCLSIPKLYEKITRPVEVTVQALNEKGKPFTLKADGLLARIIQHEYDHLDGILYIDRGDPDFKAKAEETMRRREERRLEKEKAKAAKAAKIAAKKAGK